MVGSRGSDASPHAFLYGNGAITSLPESSFTGCQARAINNTGQIAGMCTDASGSTHLVMWQNGTITNLGTLAGVESVAINSNGHIAGTVFTGGTTGGFVPQRHHHQPGQLRPERDQRQRRDGRRVLDRQRRDRAGPQQPHPAGSGYQIQIAGGINGTGQIVAYASYSTQNLSQHAVLLNPSS